MRFDGNVIRVLGAKGPFAILGYTFDSDWARRNTSPRRTFLAAAHHAKEILAVPKPNGRALHRVFVSTDPHTLSVYRQRYSEGLFRRSLTEEEADARTLYSVLAGIGGPQLVGGARELPPGTFYRAASE